MELDSEKYMRLGSLSRNWAKYRLKEHLACQKPLPSSNLNLSKASQKLLLVSREHFKLKKYTVTC